MILLSEIQKAILIEGVWDVVGLWEVIRFVQRETDAPDGDALREECLRQIRPLLMEGYVEIGEADAKGGFESWRLAVEDALHVADEEWRQLGRDPIMGELCYLKNTELGDVVAEALPE